MNPSLSAPTDNIYKFFSIFGLAIIMTSILSLTAIYTSSLDRRIGYKEKIISIENKTQKTGEEIATLALNKKLMDITKQNEDFMGQCGIIFIIAGVSCIGVGSK